MVRQIADRFGATNLKGYAVRRPQAASSRHGGEESEPSMVKEGDVEIGHLGSLSFDSLSHVVMLGAMLSVLHSSFPFCMQQLDGSSFSSEPKGKTVTSLN